MKTKHTSCFISAIIFHLYAWFSSFYFSLHFAVIWVKCESKTQSCLFKDRIGLIVMWKISLFTPGNSVINSKMLCHYQSHLPLQCSQLVKWKRHCYFYGFFFQTFKHFLCLTCDLEFRVIESMWILQRWVFLGSLTIS